jgi:YD repeat-containing protein
VARGQVRRRSVRTRAAAFIRTRVDYDSEDEEFTPYHKLYAYDRVLRLTREHKRRSGDGVSLYRYAYTYDPAGNRTQMVRFDGTTTVTAMYTYNDANQLTAREASSQEWEYSYDANGNQTVEVDATGETGWWREHTRENRLAAVHRKVRGTTVSSVSYVYDAQGRRLMRTGPDGVKTRYYGVKTRYYYDGLGVVLTKEKPVGGSWRTKHVYALKAAALGHIISERTMTAWNAQGTPTAWTDKWFHYDLLGNVTLETDANAQVTARVDMEAFGTVLTGG